MTTHSSYYPPGPREPDLVALPNASSYPPPSSFFAAAKDRARWDAKPPLSQSRPYVSPDPSPVNDAFNRGSFDTLPPSLPQHPRGFPIHPVFADQLEHGVPGQTVPKIGFSNQGFEGAEVDPWYNPVMVTPPKVAKRHNKAPKKVEVKQPTFLTKLYALLEQAEYHHIIRWDESGEAIIIEKPEELADKILPVVYRQSRFASFSRQLNIYGFNRKLSLRHVEPGVCDPDASTWSHPFLHRTSSKEEILGFKRRVPPRPTQAQKRRQIMQEEGLSPISDSDHSFRSPPDPYQHHLLPDVDEEKPFDFHPANPFATQTPHFSRGPMLMYDKPSPTSIDFDYDLPQDHVGGERFEAAFAPRPLQIPHETPFIRFFDPSFSRTPSINAPQSAPANTTSFPIPIRVTQQHIRTRSVQGELPSAMLFSPMSPYTVDSWLPSDIQVSPVEDKQLSLTPMSPTSDGDVWSPRGLKTETSANFNILHHTFPSRFASLPQALPSAYGGTSYLNRSAPLENSTVTMIAHQSCSTVNEDSPASPIGLQTVSPGVYQEGFSPPCNDQAVVVASLSPRRSSGKPAEIAQARQERRASISSSPYSARSKAQPASLEVSIGTITCKRNGEASALGLDLCLGAKVEAEEDYQALPSASISLADQHPFEEIMSAEPADVMQRD